MSSVLIQTAAAVVSALNGAADGTFLFRFEAERSYADWELPLEDAGPSDRVLVDVTPVPPMEMELESRGGSIAYQPAVDIITRFRLGPERREADGKLSLQELDGLTEFVEQLAEYFVTDTLSNGARWQASEIRRAFVPTHLHKHHQFTGIVRIQFDFTKDP